MDTLLSIIIPVCNAEHHLHRTLEQLSEQIEKKQYIDTKIIVIDDASTDASISIIEQYNNKSFIITNYLNSKIPTGAVRNKGLDLANKFESEYVAFCDSDDLLDIAMARYIALKLKYEKCPIGIAYYQQTNYRNMNAFIGQKEGIYGFNEFGLKCIGTDIPYSKLFMITNAGACNKVFSLNFINSNGIKFANTTYAEDVAFTYKSLCTTSSIHFFDELYYYYSNPDTNPGSNDRNSYNTWAELFIALDEIWQYIITLRLPNKEQLCESFLCSVIGHIRYAQKKMKTDAQKSIIGSTGFDWLSAKQHELKTLYKQSTI